MLGKRIPRSVRRLWPRNSMSPAPCLCGGFVARPLRSGEASQWLRLKGATNADEYRSRSFKAMLLNWPARAGLDKEVRAVLGHHSSALRGSDVVY